MQFESERNMTRIGVLALQGAFIEHVQALERIGVGAVEVRRPAEMEGVDGLIIPGGESTTIGKLIERFGLRDPILDLARAGAPVWGTCAGMILLARDVDDSTRARSQPLLSLMDVTVQRNAFGSQLDSFETTLAMPAIDDTPLPAVFIRAPVVARAGSDVEVLARLEDGTIVAARQGNIVVTAFHPELTGDDRIHRWFASMARVPVQTP
jgi:pyridoxal 5'-phosphate synthase pdxT subunit